MNIALYGYGKMGKAIEEAARARGHRIVQRVDQGNAGTPPVGADVAIEFSTPAMAMENMRLCLRHKVPVVVGTTGWTKGLPEIEAEVHASNGSLLWSSNFSIGVNLFFKLNQHLARLMRGQPQYALGITETHHVQKLDAPSGTAISLAQDIGQQHPGYHGWEQQGTLHEGRGDARVAVPVHSVRTGEVPGTHTVTWRSAEDQIAITHEAFGRKGFAAGAVLAAEWLPGRHGLFTMDDVLGGLEP